MALVEGGELQREARLHRLRRFLHHEGCQRHRELQDRAPRQLLPRFSARRRRWRCRLPPQPQTLFGGQSAHQAVAA